MVAEFPRGGGGGLGPFPVPQVSLPGFTFGGTPPYGYGLGIPGVFGIGSGGIEIGPLTIPFGGPSKEDVTNAAIARLRGTGNPALQRLGSQLAASGLFTSSSNPADQARMGTFVHEAVTQLEAQGFPRTRAFNIVSNVISNQPTGRINLPTQPATFAPSRVSGLNAFTSGFGAPQFGPVARAVIPQVVAGLGELAFGPRGAAVGEYVGQQMVENPPQFQLQQQPSFPPNANQQSYNAFNAGQGQAAIPNVADTSSPMSQFIPPPKSCPECGYVSPLEAQFQQPVTTFQQAGQQQPQEQPLPLQQLQPQQQPLNQTQQLRAQQQQLQQEIQTEQQQGRGQDIQQIQQQLDQLRQLENQPVESRNIQQELQQKQQLGQQIQQLLNPPPPPQQEIPPGNYVPPPPDYHPVEIGPIAQQQPQPQQPQSFIQKQPTGTQPTVPGPQSGAVKFCVQCTSQSESLKFLNGEPSECSVIA
jgi:hypothetical protein